MSTAEPLRHFGEVVLTQQAARYTLEAVDQFGKLNRGWVLDQQVDVVVRAVRLLQPRAELGTDTQEDVAQHFVGAVAENAATILRDEDQMNMQRTHDATTSAIFDTHELASE